MVVRRRDDRNGLLRDVDPERRARGRDRRESFPDALPLVNAVMVREIEVDARLAPRRHLLDDCPGHDVARREILELRGVAAHEGLARAVHEDRTLAAKRFGDEEALGVRAIERRRVKLDVLEVQRGRARPLGHRETAADRVLRVRRVEEESADAAGREDREVGEDRVDLALAVEHIRPEAGILKRVPLGDVPRLVARRDEVDRGCLREERDVLLGGEPGEEGRLDSSTGGVGRVDDARHRVRALAREIQLAARRA